jgi:hypothetical protein
MPDDDSSAVLGEKSSTSCAVASWQGLLHLAWTGSDTRLNTISSPDGRRFENKRTLPHRSSKTVTRDPGTTGVGPSRGRTLGDSTMTTETVPLAPAMVATAGGLYLAWTGTDRRLNVWGPGLDGAGHVVFPETSSEAPALGASGQDVMLAWTGTDRHLNLLQAQNGAWDRPLRLDETTSEAPSLGAVGNEIVLGWTGTDRRLNLLTLRAGLAGTPVRLDATSSHCPAVCAHLDGLVVAWIGTDRRLNVRLRRLA